MWSPTNADFSNHVSSTFLLSAWHELFHAFTPDSNQPRLHNVASLIAELADISRRCVDEERFHTHVKKIQDELNEATKAEDDILQAIPEYRSRAQYLTTESSHTAVFTGCRILEEQRPVYEKAVIDTASASLQLLPKQKQHAHASIRRLATIAFQHGKENSDVWDPIAKNEAQNVADIFCEMINLSTAGRRTYSCILAVSGPPSDVQSTLRMMGFAPKAKSELPREFVDEFSNADGHVTFLSADVESTSIRDAVNSCRRQISVGTGLMSLYRNSHTLHVNRKVLVRIDGNDFVFSDSEQAFRRLHPRSRYKEDIREGLQHLRGETTDNRLLGAIELLSLATSNPDPRVRLTNLWSAIETLTGGHEGKTTLERVLALVVPLVISRHVGRSTRYLAIETQSLADLLGDCNFGSGFQRSSQRFVSPRDMLKTLVSPPNDPAICELLKFAQHPLLRYRIFRSWKTFHDPKALRSMLCRSKTRLEWHVARIYRARNLLIYAGEESLFLVPLLDNLQNYLSMAVQRLIHELKQHPTWDVRHVVEWWSGKLNHILGSLEKNPNVLTIDDFIDGSSAEAVWN